MDNNQENENLILKKRLHTCRTAKGSLVKIPNDLTIDIIKAWERWPGTAKSFYVSIGVKKQQLASIIKKGKRLFKDRSDKLGPFVPIEVKQSESNDNNAPIILNWDEKKTISFYHVNHLVEFLKKAA
jgi:hypothetical protein